MKTNRKSFVFYFEWWENIEELPDADKLKVLETIISYAKNGQAHTLKGVSAMAFKFIKGDLERDLEKYKNIVERNRKNGQKGGAPKGNSNAEKKQPKKNNQKTTEQPKKPKQPTGLNPESAEISSEINALGIAPIKAKQPKQPKQADNDNDDDDDNDNENGEGEVKDGVLKIRTHAFDFLKKNFPDEYQQKFRNEYLNKIKNNDHQRFVKRFNNDVNIKIDLRELNPTKESLFAYLVNLAESWVKIDKKTKERHPKPPPDLSHKK